MPVNFAPALSLSVLISLAACAPDAEPKRDTLSWESLPLFPEDEGRMGLGSLRYTGGLVLDSEDDRFGGWSAMELTPDGRGLLAVSDRGHWMSAELVFDQDGQLSGMTEVKITPLRDEAGAPLDGLLADAEGLAPLGDGRYGVSFEREHRIWVYPLGEDWARLEEARPTPFPPIPGAERLRANAGAEALARVESAIWVAIEDPIVEGQPHTLWRFDLTDLTRPPVSRQVALTPGFGLTALTHDGEGGLVLLERSWRRGVGNHVQIGHFPAGALDSGDALGRPLALAMLEPEVAVDNFEAVAVVRIKGERRVFILSDDNFNAAQRTLLLSFAWPEADPAD